MDRRNPVFYFCGDYVNRCDCRVVYGGDADRRVAFPDVCDAVFLGADSAGAGYAGRIHLENI